MRFILMALAAVVSNASDPCVYDGFHNSGSMSGGCQYQQKNVINVAMGGWENPTTVFSVDGSHLNSRGAMQYLKARRNKQPSEFVKCVTSECTELSQGAVVPR
jgi:hypothetical protein